MLDLSAPEHAHAAERLRDNVMVWLSTVRPDGRPHIVPVWYLWDGAQVLIFSKPKNQKVRNLRHNPAVMLALDDTHNGADVVMIEGTAELVDDAAITAAMPAFAAKYEQRIARLSSGSAERMAAEYSQAIRITPTKLAD